MNKEEIQAIESRLELNGYKKFVTGLTSHEKYGWFRSFVDDDGELLYIIEFRIWDYSEFAYRDEYLKLHPYSLDVLVVDGGSENRIDISFTRPVYDIKTTEEIAKELHVMFEKYYNGNYDKIKD